MNTHTVYCYDRYSTHKRIGAALLLGLGAGLVSMGLFAKSSTPVQQLPRVVVTGKSVGHIAQLPRVVVVGKRQAEESALMAKVDF